MIDFNLTESGDIDYSIDRQYENFKIKFNINDYDIFRIKFHTNSKALIKPSDFRISFNIYKDNKNSIDTILENDEIIQAIKIRARTEYRELRNNLDIGSKILVLKHEQINENIINTLKEYIEKMVEDVIGYSDGITVEIKEEIGEGYFYCQNLTAYIYMNNKLLYSFYVF